jgi:putative isomerase
LKKLTYLIAITFFFSCAKEEGNCYLKFSQNILTYSISPKDKFDKSGLMFSDQGAWFGYSFPDSTHNTSFSGPFLMTQQNGIWSSESLVNLKIDDIHWNSHSTNSYNSHLEQIFTSENIELKQELVFSSGHTAQIKTEIKNISNQEIFVTYHFKNEHLLADGLTLSSTVNLLVIKSSKTDAVGYITFPKETRILSNDSIYTTHKNRILLKPNKTKEFTISQTFIFSEYSWSKEQETIGNSTFKTILEARKGEKNTQLQSLIENRSSPFLEDNYAEVLAKAHLTLQNNWRIPAGEIKHEGLFPSYHYTWFNGFWSWDSWKHAVGLSFYDTELLSIACIETLQ